MALLLFVQQHKKKIRMSRGTNCELLKKNKSRIISFRIAKFHWIEEEVELLEVTVLPSCLGLSLAWAIPQTLAKATLGNNWTLLLGGLLHQKHTKSKLVETVLPSPFPDTPLGPGGPGRPADQRWQKLLILRFGINLIMIVTKDSGATRLTLSSIESRKTRRTWGPTSKRGQINQWPWSRPPCPELIERKGCGLWWEIMILCDSTLSSYWTVISRLSVRSYNSRSTRWTRRS